MFPDGVTWRIPIVSCGISMARASSGVAVNRFGIDRSIRPCERRNDRNLSVPGTFFYCDVAAVTLRPLIVETAEGREK
jgi:hypothetical protein